MLAPSNHTLPWQVSQLSSNFLSVRSEGQLFLSLLYRRGLSGAADVSYDVPKV